MVSVTGIVLEGKGVSLRDYAVICTTETIRCGKRFQPYSSENGNSAFAPVSYTGPDTSLLKLDGA